MNKKNAAAAGDGTKKTRRRPNGSFYQVNLLTSSFKLHIPDQDSYLCDHCGGVWVNKKKFVAHRKQVLSRQAANVVMCEVCGVEMLDMPGVVRSHHLKHHSGRSFDCKVCGKKLSSTSHLRGHMKTHEEAKLACRFCGKVIKYKNTLLEHKKKHMMSIQNASNNRRKR